MSLVRISPSTWVNPEWVQSVAESGERRCYVRFQWSEKNDGSFVNDASAEEVVARLESGKYP